MTAPFTEKRKGTTRIRRKRRRQSGETKGKGHERKKHGGGCAQLRGIQKEEKLEAESERKEERKSHRIHEEEKKKLQIEKE